jgi:cullin 2
MVEPLKENLVNLLLEGIHYDRLGEASPNITDIIRGVINSFVSVEEYKRRGKLEVSFRFWLPFMKKMSPYPNAVHGHHKTLLY